MSVFDLDQQGWADRVSAERLRPASTDETPGAFARLFPALGLGALRAGAETVRTAGVIFAGTVGRALNEAFEADGSTAASDALFRATDKWAGGTVEALTPDHRTTGSAAMALGGFSESMTSLALGGGNPSLMLANAQFGTSGELVREGVDAKTAVGVGAVSSLSTAAGFKIPIIGKTLTQRMTAGAVGNLLVNTGATAAQREILEARDYGELAQNYDPADVEARAVDVLSGVVFGALYHATAPSQVAGTATINNAKHFQVDTAPGRIDTVNASAAHQAALGDAIEQATRGEPVNVPREVLDVEFAPRPPREVPIPAEYKELDANRAARAVPEVTVETSDDGRQVTLRTPNGFTEARVKGGEFLQITDTKTAEGARKGGEGTARIKRLLEIAKERGLTLVSDTKVSPQAARFYDRLAAEGFHVIRNAARADSEGHLVSEDSRPIFEVHPKESAYSAVHGETAGTLGRPELQAQQDLGATREGAPGGAGVPGARRVTVPAFRGGLGDFTAGEFGRRAVAGPTSRPTSGLGVQFHRSAEHAADFGKVSAHNLNIENPKVIKAEDFPHLRTAKEYGDYADQLRAQGHDALVVTGESRSGPVDIYVLHPDVVEGLAKEAKAAKPAAEGAKAVDPDVAAAHAVIDAAGDSLMIPTGAVDAEGKPIARPASEVMAEAEAGIKEAENDAKGFEAAVSCWIARGVDAR